MFANRETGRDRHSQASSAARRIVILGHHPPPWGGVSVHVWRLTQRLVADGMDVLVADPHSRRVIQYTSGQKVIYRGVHALKVMLSWMAGSVCHVHISGGRRFYRTAMLMRAVIRTARKRVVTIHSGSWKASLISETLATRTFRGFDNVICVNQTQRDILVGYGVSRERISVLPAYLVSSTVRNTIPEQVYELGRKAQAVLVTSGYGTNTYDFMTVIRAFKLVRKRVSMDLGLVIATYAKWDEEYWTKVTEAAREVEEWCVITKDLDPESFISVLTMGRIYVRATVTDGDAVAIREAGSVDLQVIASSVTPRPSGVLLFRVGDATDLADKIVQALFDPELGRLSEVELRDTFPEIREIYNS